MRREPSPKAGALNDPRPEPICFSLLINGGQLMSGRTISRTSRRFFSSAGLSYLSRVTYVCDHNETWSRGMQSCGLTRDLLAIFFFRRGACFFPGIWQKMGVSPWRSGGVVVVDRVVNVVFRQSLFWVSRDTPHFPDLFFIFLGEAHHSENKTSSLGGWRLRLSSRASRSEEWISSLCPSGSRK
jgi:hypothetical protein